jgi:hypothetical protein
MTPEVSSASGQAYKVNVKVTKVTAGTGNPEFWIERTAEGANKYECTPKEIKFGCSTSGEW